MPKSRAIVRQWTLLRVLSNHDEGLSLGEMAHHMSVNERTIRRDLKLFMDAGIPLRETIARGGKKIWRIEQRGTMLAGSVSSDESMALLVAARILAPLQASQFYTILRSCCDRVVSGLAPGERRRVERQTEGLHLDWINESRKGLNSTAVDSYWQALLSGESVELSCRAAFNLGQPGNGSPRDAAPSDKERSGRSTS